MTSKIIDAIARNLRCPQKGIVGWTVKRRMTKKNRFLEEEAVRLCQVEPQHQVLEIGFGPGIGLQAAYNKVKGGEGKLCGVDLSPYMVEVASKRMREGIRAGQVNISVGSVCQLPFDDDSFDRIYHTNSYYFWPDMRLALQELHRVIKPGGIMVATLNMASLRDVQKQGKMKYGEPDPVKFMWALEQFGFEEVHMEYLKYRETEYQAILAKVNEKPALDLEEEQGGVERRREGEKK